MMLLAKQKLEKKIIEDKDIFLAKIKELEMLLSNAKNNYSDLIADNEKKISEYKHKSQLLLARVKQFQTGLQQNPNQQYEVKAIINHKDTKN